MICFAATVIRCVAREPQSIHFSGWPTSASASLFVDGVVPMSVAATARPAFTASIISGTSIATLPAYPPFPVPSNLSFQPDAGSQTSTLMSESLVGVSVAVTLQNGRTSLYVRPSGPVKLGPGTETAEVMTPSCRWSVTSVSQTAAVARVVDAAMIVRMKQPQARMVRMATSRGAAVEEAAAEEVQMTFHSSARIRLYCGWVLSHSMYAAIPDSSVNSGL